MDLYEDSFQHEALFYAGDDEFLAGTLPFVQGAIERDEQVLIALGEANTNLLRGALGRDAERAIFTPMETLGQNPARIIPAWRDFVAANARPGQPVRGIGEPIWPGRTDDEVVECHHHEALLNYAFDDGPRLVAALPLRRERARRRGARGGPAHPPLAGQRGRRSQPAGPTRTRAAPSPPSTGR